MSVLEAMPEAVLEVLEALQPEHSVTQDEQRPPLSHDLEGAGDRADLIRIVALQHALILADLFDKSQVRR